MTTHPPPSWASRLLLLAQLVLGLLALGVAAQLRAQPTDDVLAKVESALAERDAEIARLKVWGPDAGERPADWPDDVPTIPLIDRPVTQTLPPPYLDAKFKERMAAYDDAQNELGPLQFAASFYTDRLEAWDNPVDAFPDASALSETLERIEALESIDRPRVWAGGPQKTAEITEYASPDDRLLSVVPVQLRQFGQVKYSRLKFSFNDFQSAITSEKLKGDATFLTWVDDCEFAGTQDRDERPVGRGQGLYVATNTNFFNVSGMGGFDYLRNVVASGVTDDGLQGNDVAIDVTIHMAKRDDALGVRYHPDGAEYGGRHPSPWLERVRIHGRYHSLGMIIGGKHNGTALGCLFEGRRSMEMGTGRGWRFYDCRFPSSVTFRGDIADNVFVRCDFARVGGYELRSFENNTFIDCRFEWVSSEILESGTFINCEVNGVRLHSVDHPVGFVGPTVVETKEAA
ncbi:MAG: hypothetical protein AAFY08_14385 [Planctomycetota bacterium]